MWVFFVCFPKWGVQLDHRQVLLCNHSLELHLEQDCSLNAWKVIGAYAEVQCHPYCYQLHCTEQCCVPASCPLQGQELHQPYAQAEAFSLCERCVSDLSMVDIPIISNAETQGISVLASTVELSIGNQWRHWKQNCCYFIALWHYIIAVESNAMINENNSGSKFSFLSCIVLYQTDINIKLPFLSVITTDLCKLFQPEKG